MFLSSAFFSKLAFSKNSFSNAIRMSNSLDPDQDRRRSLSGSKLFATVVSREQKSPLARKEFPGGRLVEPSSISHT